MLLSANDYTSYLQDATTVKLVLFGCQLKTMLQPQHNN